MACTADKFHLVSNNSRETELLRVSLSLRIGSLVLRPQTHYATYHVIVTVNFDLREGTASRDSSSTISFHRFFASSNIQSHWRERTRTKTIASIKNPEALYIRFDSFIHLFAFLTRLSVRRNTRCSRVRILRTYACRVCVDY